MLGLVLEMITDKIAAVRSAAAKLASKLIELSKLDVEKAKDKIQPYIGNEVWYIRFAALEIIKNLVPKKSYLKFWELARTLLNDKVASIKIMLVEIADKINEYGVRSCMEEVRSIRAEVQDLF